jgi:murein L,D-transpeptidase YcbB/YkuD
VRNIDPASVDWATVSASDLGNYRMVQAAGDNNALGQIRVLMSNPYDIYLHDTSSPALFNQPERLLSSGCVRVSQPDVLAKFVLANNENWSEEKMTKILSSHKTVEIPADEHIPVFIVYQTIWPDRQGNLVYGSDIYGNDNVLIKALKDKGELKLPSLDRLPDNIDKSGKLASAR